MERAEAEKKVKDLVSRKTGLNPDEILLDSKIDDICKDSIQMFELVMEFEKELERKLGYADICGIETVGDIVEKMEKES